MNTRTYKTFPVSDIQVTQLQMLNWANRFNICSLLDSHADAFPHQSYSCIASAGAAAVFRPETDNPLQELQTWADEQNDWLFGHLCYDLKNSIEPGLSSALPARIKWPVLSFFRPETTLELNAGSLRIGSLNGTPDLIWKEISAISPTTFNNTTTIRFTAGMSKDAYIERATRIKAHIHRGDCYEVNFCQEFYAENINADPLTMYTRLSNVSPAPFAAYYKNENQYLLCASPERYISKTGSKLISQPIKGTRQRDHQDPLHDAALIEELRNDPKERAENIMVVDLVRNDLSRISTEGSVQVEELCGIYSFPQVHQMISTITGQADPEKHWTDYFRATFPMGSMTGAPKKKVMELIEKYETANRGLYSGAVGYIRPNGDFDFNVVIRSLQYDTDKQLLSYHVGSAITSYCDPEKEYAECLLKAEGIRTALT